MRYTFEQFKELLRSVGFPESVLDTMAAIGLAESSGDPYVVRDCPGTGFCRIVRNGQASLVRAVAGQRPETSVGLFQINRRAHPQYNEVSLYNPVQNARAALEIYQKQGLKAWGSYTDGNYRAFLPGGSSPVPGGGLPGVIGWPGGFSGSEILNWFKRPVEDASSRFQPFLEQRGLSSSQRFQVAAVIALIVIAFAWGEFRV